MDGLEISKQNSNRVLNAINFKEYYSQRVKDLKPAGGQNQVLGICPFHNDTKGSLSMNIANGLWNCKGCGESGDVFTFHMKINPTGKGFPGALRDLARLYNVELIPHPSEKKDSQDKGQKKPLFPPPKKSKNSIRLSSIVRRV